MKNPACCRKQTGWHLLNANDRKHAPDNSYNCQHYQNDTNNVKNDAENVTDVSRDELDESSYKATV